MTRLEIATKVIELSGRFDLVTDPFTSDYSDSGPIGVNFYIDEGSRWLDANTTIRNQLTWWKQDIESSQQFILVPRMRAPKEVWMANADTNRYILSKISYGQLREDYGSTGETADQPLYWSPATSRFHESQHDLAFRGSDLVTDGDFSASTNWTTSGGASISGGLLTFSGTAAGYATQDISATVGLRYEIIFTVSGHTTGSVTVYIGVNSVSTAVTTNATHTQEVNANGGSLYIVSSADFDGDIDDISVTQLSAASPFSPTYDTADVGYGQMFNQQGIVWAPPADAVYTISLLGLFYEKELSLDADENYWSSIYPNALINATLMKMEEHTRNRQGVADYLSAVRSEIQGVEWDLVEDEMAGVNQMTG